jgi:hypothetical protein
MTMAAKAACASVAVVLSLAHIKECVLERLAGQGDRSVEEHTDTEQVYPESC